MCNRHLSFATMGLSLALASCSASEPTPTEGPPVATAILQGESIRFEVIDGEAIYQTDINLGPFDDLERRVQDAGGTIMFNDGDQTETGLTRSELIAINNRPCPVIDFFTFGTLPDQRWADGIVPFEIGGGYSAAEQMQVASLMTQAAQDYAELTSIRFVPRSGEGNFVRIRNFTAAENPDGRACGSSALGRQGGRQDLRLSPTASLGCLKHELAHALGIAHEQARNDRNDHVIVRTNLVSANRRHNFDREPTCGFDDVGPYDLDSIMHYPAWAFEAALGGCSEANRALCPIEPRDIDGVRVPLARLGTSVLSDLDRRGLCEVYGNPTQLRIFVDGRALSGGVTGVIPAGAPPRIAIDYEWRGVEETVNIDVISNVDGVVFSGPVRPVAFDATEIVLSDLSAGRHALTVRVTDHCPTDVVVNVTVTPALRITSPTNNAEVSYARAFGATAEVYGLGAGALQWTLDGSPIAGATAADEALMAPVGRHTLGVQADFPDGVRLTDSVSILVTNSAPTVQILAPTEMTACRSEMTQLRASANDTDQLDGNLTVEWFYGGANIASGAAANVSFETNGTARLEVRVTDELGSTATDGFDLTVRSCGALPTLAVSWPANDSTPRPGEDHAYFWDGNDGTQWFKDLRPRATANDPEDGRLTGTSIEWLTNQTAIQPALLGTGEAPTLRLRGSCFGTTHTVTVRATDSVGNERSMTFVIRVWRLC